MSDTFPRPTHHHGCRGEQDVAAVRLSVSDHVAAVRRQMASELSLPAHMQSQPPSTGRLMPFIAPFSSRKRDASTTSAIVTSRPVGVRETRA